MPKKNVFISHSQTNSKWARKLAKELESKGLQVWLDEELMKPGSSAQRGIEKALKESDTIIALVDEESATSPNLFFEMGLAVAMEKRILPVLLGEVDTSKLPFDMKQRKFLKNPVVEKVVSELVTPEK